MLQSQFRLQLSTQKSYQSDDHLITCVGGFRNLLCVYSKKHINDVPDLAEMKTKANARTLMQMTMLLRCEEGYFSSIVCNWCTSLIKICVDWIEFLGVVSRKGGQLLWVAPSGGRDRPDPETNEWVPVRLPSPLLVLMLVYL